jgi:chloramphenicol-sensitive protein RarD
MNPRNGSLRPEVAETGRHSRTGFLLGLGAYALWGVLPIYFKAIADVAAVDIVAHRVLWSLPFLAILIAVSRGWQKV